MPRKLPKTGDLVWVVNTRTPHYARVRAHDDDNFYLYGFPSNWNAKGYGWAWLYHEPLRGGCTREFTTRSEEITGI